MYTSINQFDFDDGVAVQFAQFILSKDWKSWKSMMEKDAVPLCELANALCEYHNFAIIGKSQQGHSKLSAIVGFNVFDLTQEDAKCVLITFCKSLSRFYEQSLIPFYVASLQSKTDSDVQDSPKAPSYRCRFSQML